MLGTDANVVSSAVERGAQTPRYRIFRWRRFPWDYARPLTLALDPDEEIAEATLAALARTRHSTARGLALDFVTAGRRLAGAVGLLEPDFEPGDFARVDVAAEAFVHDDETYHTA